MMFFLNLFSAPAGEAPPLWTPAIKQAEGWTPAVIQD